MTRCGSRVGQNAVMHNTAFPRIWWGVILGLREAHERCEFITLLGSAAAGNAGDRVPWAKLTCRRRGDLRSFRQGLKDSGYVEGDNVVVELTRWAEISTIGFRLWCRPDPQTRRCDRDGHIEQSFRPLPPCIAENLTLNSSLLGKKWGGTVHSRDRVKEDVTTNRRLGAARRRRAFSNHQRAHISRLVIESRAESSVLDLARHSVGALVYFWIWWLRPEHNIGTFSYVLQSDRDPVADAPSFVFHFHFIPRSRASAASGARRLSGGDGRNEGTVEPFPIVRETLEAMLRQAYPHDTWLADEDPSPETIKSCRERGVMMSTRKGGADYHR